MIHLRISYDQYKILRTIYQLSEELQHEICMIGSVIRDKKNATLFILKEISMPDQTVTSSTTDMDEDQLIKLTMQNKQFNFWFHTHPGFGASFSGVDDHTIRNLSKKSDYFISMIIAEDYKTCVRLDIERPIPLTLQLKLEIADDNNSILYKTYKQQIQKHIKVNKSLFNKMTSLFRQNEFDKPMIDNLSPYKYDDDEDIYAKNNPKSTNELFPDDLFNENDEEERDGGGII